MSATLQLANNATSTLASAVLATDTTCVLAPGTGVLFPQLTGAEYFVGTFTDTLTRTLREIVQVNGITGDTITSMVRGQEGTTPQPWKVGDVFSLQITAASLKELTSNAPNSALLQNANVIATNLTVPPGFNAALVGPITVNPGVIITVPAGAILKVL